MVQINCTDFYTTVNFRYIEKGYRNVKQTMQCNANIIAYIEVNIQDP